MNMRRINPLRRQPQVNSFEAAIASLAETSVAGGRLVVQDPAQFNERVPGAYIDNTGQPLPFDTLPVPIDLDAPAREAELGMQPAEEVHYEPTSVIPLPDYVQHNKDATPTGMVVGEAIVKEYENAAREIEALGEELKTEFAKAEARAAQFHAALTNLTDTAKAYRAEAKRVFEHMQACATKADDVTEFAKQVRAKLATQSD